MESLLRDFRIAVRGLIRNPGFSAVAIVTLALGIGATTSVFSVVYGVLLRPLPFPGADRLLLTVSGLVIGLAGSYPSAQALSSLLFGITPGDLTTFVVAATLLMATAVIACLVPSSRATRVDPVVALRAE